MQRPIPKRPFTKRRLPPSPDLGTAVDRVSRIAQDFGDASHKRGRIEALRDVRSLLKSLERPCDPARKALLTEIRAGLRDIL